MGQMANCCDEAGDAFAIGEFTMPRAPEPHGICCCGRGARPSTPGVWAPPHHTPLAQADAGGDDDPVKTITNTACRFTNAKGYELVYAGQVNAACPMGWNGPLKGNKLEAQRK